MDYLIKVAYWIIFANWVDMFWMVMPAYSSKAITPFPEIGIFLGFAGAFGLTVQRFLTRVPVIPQKDPRLEEALHLHQ
jgi:hypothetical protein